MRRRLFPNFVGDVVELEERQERMERVMQMLGITPEFPYTMNVNDGTRNRVRIGLIGADYGIEIVDNAGNNILLANGTIIANAIKSGTLDCGLITVTNLDAGSITVGTLSASKISGGILNCSLMIVSDLSANSITDGTFPSPNDRFTDNALSGVKITQNTISGDRIIANSINADRIQAGTITADRITAHTIVADRIQDNSLGTQQMIFNGVNADRIVTHSITADKMNVSSLSAISSNIGTITAGTINADTVNVQYLNASNLNRGTLSIGYAGSPTGMYIARGSIGDAKFYFEGGSRMWSDSSNRIGINSLGSPMYIYVDSTERIVIPSSGQTSIRGGVYCDGSFNVVNASSRFGGTVITEGDVLHNNRTWLKLADKTLTLGQSLSVYNTTSVGSGYLNSGGSQMNWWNGKNAIIKLADKYRALYCIESPEVWFVDFCKDSKSIDPLFLEATEGEMKFTKCVKFDVDGNEIPDGYQVWRRRAGVTDRRFDERSEREFNANNVFWNTPRQMAEATDFTIPIIEDSL